MTSESKTEPKVAPKADFNLPLFYKQPQPLFAGVHGGLRLKNEPDFRFAARTNAVPIMGPEFVEAQRDYPIVFVGDAGHPAVVLGLEQGNLFVDSAGAWSRDHYIPAYVRRYPFVFIENADRTQYALGIDLASDRVITSGSEQGKGGGGTPLFDGDQPSQLTQEALRFAGLVQASQVETRTFCEALVKQELLVDQQARGTLPNGKSLNFGGFRIVDVKKLQELPDSVVVEWHRNGWLALVHYHVASLQRWRDLLARQGAPAPAAVYQSVGA
jgi:hypothetical protein